MSCIVDPSSSEVSVQGEGSQWDSRLPEGGVHHAHHRPHVHCETLRRRAQARVSLAGESSLGASTRVLYIFILDLNNGRIVCDRNVKVVFLCLTGKV